jgi:Bacterial membrane protein YfhO
MRGMADGGWRSAYQRLRQVMWGGTWRQRLITLALIIGINAGVLTVTYRAVVFHGRTLLTGTYVQGTEFIAGPYGYPGPPLNGWNEVDAGPSAWAWVPQIRKANLELAHGELPLWDANVMLGAPLAADAEHGLFNPLTWPLVAHPTNGAWDIWLLARLLAAGVLCTYLCRYLGLRWVPATIAGLIFMMSGVFQMRTTTIQTGIMATLPLLILGVERCLRQPSRVSSAILALAIASTVLFGMPEESFLCLLMGAAWFLVRFAAEWTRQRGFPAAKAAYSAIGGAVVGVLFSLPLLLPLAEYLGVAFTNHGPTSRASLQLEQARDLLSLVGPHWNIVGPRSFSGSFAPLDNWFGIGALLLAVIGLFSRALPRGARALLLITAVLVEAKVVGFPGWYNQLFANTPVLGQISFWAYSGVLVSLSVALLAGAGLQRLELRLVRARYVLASAFVVAAAVAAAAPTFLAGTSIRWSQVGLTVVFLLFVAAGALLATHRRSWTRRLGLGVVAGAITAELIGLATPELTLPLRYDYLTPTPTTAYLQKAMPSGTGRSYSPTGILYPTTNQAFNLDDIRNLDPIFIERTYRYLKLFVAPGLSDRFDGSPPNVAQFANNPFFDVLNVQRILIGPPVSANAAALPVDQFALESVGADGVGIYRNLHASPRAQVVFNASRSTSEDNSATVMQRPGFDPTTSAVVETSQYLPSSNRKPVPAHIDSYDDSRIVMTTNTQAPGTLVLADAYYPGWQAELDGHPTTIHPVDLALRGVEVPAGTHTVTMEYRPQSIVLGALGVPVGIALFVLGGWIAPTLLRIRRRRGGPEPA